MAVDTIQFRVELTGKEQIEELQAMAKSINNSTLELKIKKGNIAVQLADLDRRINKATQDRDITFKANMKGIDEMRAEVEKKLKPLKDQKAELQLELKGSLARQIAEVKRDLQAVAGQKDITLSLKNYDTVISKLKAAQAHYKTLTMGDAQKDELEAARINRDYWATKKLTIESNLGQINTQARELTARLEGLISRKYEIQAEIAGLDEKIGEIEKEFEPIKELEIEVNTKKDKATEDINDLKRQKKDLVDEDNLIDLQIQANGLNLQQINGQLKEMEANARAAAEAIMSIGTGIQGVGNILQTGGGILQSLNNFFGGNFVSAIEGRIRRTLAKGVISSFSDAVKRYDVFNQFPQIMDVLGFGEGADKIVEDLNESVQGLPTTLDEIVASAQEFIMLTNDPQLGKNLAISLNNALLSSGRDEAWQQNARDQIVNILTGGDLSDDQWRSMFRGLGVSLGYIGEEFGFATNEVADFQKALMDGEISAQDFVKALVDAGQKGGIKELTEISTDLLQSSLKNLRTAVVNAEASFMQEVDSILTDYTGKTLVGNIIAVSDAIKKKLIPQMRDWMQAHPEAITNFFDRLANYDWLGLLSKIGKGAMQYFDFMSKFYTAFPTGFVAWIMTKGELVGKGLTVIGKAFSMLGKGITALGASKLFGKISKGGGLSGLIKGIFGGEGGGGINLPMKGLGFAAGSTGLVLGSIAAIGGIVYEYGKVIEAIGKIDVGNFSKNIKPVTDAIVKTFALVETVSAIFAAIGKKGQLAMLGGEAVVGGGVLLTEGIIHAIGSAVDLVKDVANLPDTLEKMSGEVTESNIKKWGKDLKKMIGVIGDVFNGIFDALDRNNNGFLLGELYSSSKQKRILENLEESIGNISKIAEVFTNLRLAFEPLFRDRTTKEGIDYTWFRALKKEFPVFVKEVGEMFMSISEALDLNGNGNLAWEETWKASGAEAILGDLNGAIESVNKIGTQLDSMSELLVGLTSKPQSPLARGAKTKMETIGENFKTTLDGIMGIFEGIYEATSDEYGGMLGKYLESLVAGGTLSNINTAIANVRTIIANLKLLETGVTDIIKDDRMKTISDSVVKFIGSEASGGLTAIFRALDTQLGYGGNTDISGITTSLDGAMANLVTIMKSIKTLQDTYGSMFELKQGIGDGTYAGQDALQFANQILKFLGNDTSGLTGVFKALAGITQIEGMDTDIGEKVTQMGTAIDGLKGIFDKLMGIQTSVDALAPDGEFNVAKGLAAIIGGLTGALNGVTGGGGLVEALSNVTSAMDDAEGAASKLKTAIEQLQDKIDDFNTTTAQEQLSSLVSSMGRVQFAAMMASAMVSGLASAIDRLHDKTITLTVNRQGDWTTNAHTGGLITGGGLLYRAGGGSIFKPRGTDTVPAMLTPGEYVMKRSALNAFGAKFMQKVNNLDIDGAFRSLMVRAGSGLISRTMSNVTNNYRDNHSTVNIYGKEGRRGMDYRRAGRYVRAL